MQPSPAVYNRQVRFYHKETFSKPLLPTVYSTWYLLLWPCTGMQNASRLAKEKETEGKNREIIAVSMVGLTADIC